MTNIILYLHIGDIPETNLQSQSQSGQRTGSVFCRFSCVQIKRGQVKHIWLCLEGRGPRFSLTPPTINMEPKNRWFEMFLLFQQGIFRFHVSFPGCSSYKKGMLLAPSLCVFFSNDIFQMFHPSRVHQNHQSWQRWNFWCAGNSKIFWIFTPPKIGDFMIRSILTVRIFFGDGLKFNHQQ